MQRFRNILVVADGQSAYEHAFERVRWLAAANEAHVTLIDVVATPPGQIARLVAALPGRSAGAVEEQVDEVRRARLDGLAAPLREAGLSVDTVLAHGTPFIEIIRQVLRAGHDLVLKGAQRMPSRPFLQGADMHLMRKCPCPVWVLNSAAEPMAGRILAAVDPDPADPARHRLARTVMELATSLARRDGARLDVLHAWNFDDEATLRHPMAKVPAAEVDAMVAAEERQSAERLAALTADFAGFDDIMRVLHLRGVPDDVIPEHVAAEGIDTVVMGTLARTGVAGLFIGNTAETILNRVSCSVLTVKAEGFVSPVTADDA